MQDFDSSENSLAQSDGKTGKPFRLLRYFTIICLASVITTSFFLGSWVRQISVDNLVQSEERNNIALTQVLSNSVWPRFHEFIVNAHQLSADEIRTHPTTKILDNFIHEQVRNLKVIKIKIYDLNGLTVFSSDFKQIGHSKQSHPSFLQAKHGQVISKLSFRDKIYAKKELIQNRNVISSYVPINPYNKDNIEGVFEVYKDVTLIMEEIDATQTRLITGIIAALGVLFFVLFFVVRHADKIIQEYNLAQQQTTEEISQIAFYDGLTGLPNRILFMERMKHALQAAVRSQKLVVLMFIDLDRFKQINDNLGHEAGDTLLCQVADRFIGCVRTGDTVARISGDEFTIILENLYNIERATSVAQRIINELSQPFLLGNNEACVTCSIGLSIYPYDDDDVGSLVKKADSAMYFSKSYGRNNYHYFKPDMLRHGSEAYDLESRLNNALAESQFRLFFQPKVNLTDWTMHGMEALIRWQHPEKGIIPPDQFIPILEETGHIIQVGEWVLRESCRVTKQWQNEGLPPLCVAVNVSALQFRQPGFLDMIDSILNETGLNPKYLELELTESCLLEDIDETIQIMQNLKNKGIKLTIDDFGTGYSSLSYLCKLPVDVLKIDRCFVQDMMDNHEKRSIVTAIISFAHGLKMDVVAEGIESMQQLIFVSAMRCTSVQGFLLSKAIPEQEFYTLYKAGGSFKYLVDNQPVHEERNSMN